MTDGSVAEAKPLITLRRCGHSKNKPYCDGSHNDVGFDGSAQCSSPPIFTVFDRDYYSRRV